MTGLKFRLEGLTFAIENMDDMLHFYSSLFDLSFEKDEKRSTQLGQDLFSSTVVLTHGINPQPFKLLFCPNSLAGVDARQNRQQWDVVVDDLHGLLEKLTHTKGKLMAAPTETASKKSCALIDPDGNTIVLTEYLAS